MRYRPGFILTAPPTLELAHLLAVAQRPLLQGHPPHPALRSRDCSNRPPILFLPPFHLPGNRLALCCIPHLPAHSLMDSRLLGSQVSPDPRTLAAPSPRCGLHR